MSTNRGFTLVEIIIVTAIIVILSVIAIPQFLVMRMNANESSAISSLRTVSTACEGFRSAQNPVSYPANLAALSAAVPPYIDSILGSGAKQGYTFTYELVNTDQYICTAAPATPNVTGIRTFFLDESGVIRIDNAAGNPIE